MAVLKVGSWWKLLEVNSAERGPQIISLTHIETLICNQGFESFCTVIRVQATRVPDRSDTKAPPQKLFFINHKLTSTTC